MRGRLLAPRPQVHLVPDVPASLQRGGQHPATTDEPLHAVQRTVRTPVTALRIDVEGVHDPALAERLRHHVGNLQRSIDAIVNEARRPVRHDMASTCDAVAVVSAPRIVQLRRVLDRPGMSLRKLHGIEARQMPDAEKRKRADFVIPTGLGRRPTWVGLRKALTQLRR